MRRRIRRFAEVIASLRVSPIHLFQFAPISPGILVRIHVPSLSCTSFFNAYEQRSTATKENLSFVRRTVIAYPKTVQRPPAPPHSEEYRTRDMRGAVGVRCNAGI